MSKSKPLDQISSTVADALSPTTKVQNISEFSESIMSSLRATASKCPRLPTDRQGKHPSQTQRYHHAVHSGAHVKASLQSRDNCLRTIQSQEVPGQRNAGERSSSEPTLCRIEQGMDEEYLAGKMADFKAPYHRELTKDDEPDIICIDGKSMRGTVQNNGRNPDVVSAYSSTAGITLATEACQEKSNEIKAGPKLLDKLDVKGQVITADAMSMQKDIIDKIREKGADFVIELKANQALPALRSRRQHQVCNTSGCLYRRPGNRTRQNRNPHLQRV